MQSVDVGLLHIILVVITPVYAQYRYGDIRLVGGSYQWEGRVEIFISGTWGTITDSEWTNNDAQVVCHKLGHFKPDATAHTDAYFGEGSGPIHLDFVQCSGSEYNLTECEIRNDRVRTSHSLDVGVKCQPGSYREGEIRLVGGSYNWEGRVEIYWTGTWGTISDTSWSDSDAQVVCRQLGHSTNGVIGRCCAYYGEGSGAIHIQRVTCSGSETSITNCTYINSTVGTNHAQDVGVECQQGDDIKEGDIRLVAGSYLWQGRVEIFLDGVWGTVTIDYEYYYHHYYYHHYIRTFAKVICQQLGYKTYSYDYGVFSDRKDVIHFDIFICYGSEYRITDCQYTYSTGNNDGDWGVYCSVDGPQIGDVRLTSRYYGRPDVFLSGIWEPVTNSSRSWTLANSKVVCRELGYNGTVTYYPNTYKGTFSAMRNMIDNVDCIGTESKLIDCSHNINYLNSYNSARVDCQYYDCGDGDIRLVNGESEVEGRVEVCHNGRWGTVCDSQWTDNHTAVVCRYLGFSDIIGESTYFRSEKFGEGSGPIFIDYVNCTGSESRLWRSSQRLHRDCLSYTHYYGCSHSGDVGIRCQSASCSNGQIRLIEGYSENEGRVEICSSQRWETLSYHYWSSSEAYVACISLGFNYGYYSCCANYGRGGGPIHQKYFQCTGTEQDLSQCDSNDTTPRTHDEDVGIECYGDCTNGEIRLMEGESEFEGRLEVCINSRWGTVGSNGWTKIDEQVICNDLGYDLSDNETVKQSIPQALSKPVHLHNIVCSSTDLHLLECSFSKYLGNINNIQDVIITCQQSSCKDGDLKLVGGISENEGRLEVCFDQRWGTINGDGWTHTDTQVACRQLGYSTSDVSYSTTQRTQSSTSLPAHLSLVGCYGSEEKLIDCAHHEHTSSTTIDISISCISSNSEDSSSSTKLHSLAAASLSIAIICATALIVLIAVLILAVVFWQRGKHTQSNQHGTGQSQNTDTVRYTTGGGISNISTDTKTVDPLLYEDPLGDFGVEVPVTTKPQVKKSAATATAPIYESPD